MSRRRRHRTHLAMLEELATDLYGPATSIGIDHDGVWTRVRVWSADGRAVIREVSSLGGRAAAVREALWHLRREKRARP